MNHGYLRVSTDKQDAENQRIGIDAEAVRRGLTIDEYIVDDAVSGAVEPDKRKLGALLRKIKPGDVIIAGEISRLGRSLFMVMRILEHCMKCGAKVYTVKDGYELGDNIQSKVLAFAFGLAAEIERNLISQRTKESLARIKASGRKLGRAVGSKNKSHKLDGVEPNKIWDAIADGKPLKAISRSLKISAPTLRRWIKANNEF
jgi:DNA invertase Pin-like site-specific DNA recombinase